MSNIPRYITKRPREGSMDLESGLEAKKSKTESRAPPSNLTKSKSKSMMNIAGQGRTTGRPGVGGTTTSRPGVGGTSRVGVGSTAASRPKSSVATKPGADRRQTTTALNDRTNSSRPGLTREKATQTEKQNLQTDVEVKKELTSKQTEVAGLKNSVAELSSSRAGVEASLTGTKTELEVASRPTAAWTQDAPSTSNFYYLPLESLSPRKQEMSLQKALLRRRKDFVERSKARVAALHAARDARVLNNCKTVACLAEVAALSPRSRMLAEPSFTPVPVVRVFNYRDMVRATRERFNKLPEVLKLNIKKREKRVMNRLMAQKYSSRLQRKVVRDKVAKQKPVAYYLPLESLSPRKQEKMSLQEALLRRRKDFLERSEARVAALHAARDARVLNKKYRLNRLMAQIYSSRLQRKVVRGTVSLTHHQLVV